MPETPYDVIIVGSGPSGACAAIDAARAGLKVLILEREPLPRYKTCGGGLTQRTLALLPVDIQPAVERELRSFDFRFLQSGLHYKVQRSETLVCMVMRDAFDHLLVTHAQKSGAELIDRCAVTDVTRHDDHVAVETSRGTYRGRFVVGADGATSVVAKRAGWPELPHLAPAVEHEIQVDEATMRRFSRSAFIDFQTVDKGYGWVFPKATHLSVGLAILRKGGKNLNQKFRDYLQTLGIEPLSSERHGFFIPLRPRAEAVSRDRVLLVGDAAGVADPFSAEGIFGAVHSGQAAARALREGKLEPHEVDRLYQAHMTDEVFPELRVGRLFSQVFFDHTRVRQVLFRLQGQRLSELAIDATTGKRTYRSIVRSPTKTLQ